MTGAGVRIGSIDTGVDASHPELAGKVVAWRDFVAGGSQPYDDNGHGTHTVGTMVGGVAGRSPVGVAPGASVVVARAIGADGVARGSTLLAAAQWIADPDGNPATADQPQVVNNSWATNARGDTWFRPMVRRWLALGIVPVFAAGNTGPGPSTVASPADYPESLAVGSIGSSGDVSSFSARGPVVWTDPDGTGPAAGTALPKPDLVAPGEGIASTLPGGRYAAYSGTSMAAPHVAGAAALLRQAAPAAEPAAVIDALRRSASDRGPAGPDAAYGWGVLDLPAAVAALTGALPAQAPAAAAPAPDRRPGSRAGRRGPIRMTAAQMRATRRIARAAGRRLVALERRVAGRAAPWPLLRASTRVPLRRSAMLTTRRIARDAMVRAGRLEARLRGASYAELSRGPAGSGALTPEQMRITDRMARAALARVVALERVVAQRRADGIGSAASASADRR
jgi:subtilisin family serine protease